MIRSALRVIALAAIACGLPLRAGADGIILKPVAPPGKYAGSVEERSQEAVIIFHGSQAPGGAVEDLILKVGVQGDLKTFGWVIPFPTEPKTAKEDPKLFSELHTYVEHRLYDARRKFKGSKGEAKPAAAERAAPGVEVLSRKVVGSYEISVVREKVEGGLAAWLEKEKFQKPEDPADVIGFYRRKGYVFACVKVSDAELEKDRPVDLHPIRFTFKTGGRDGIYFPMKLTGLQKASFDINLYLFYQAWINDKLSKYGYLHRGFRLRYRDWDTPACEPNAGKSYSAPQTDPFLKAYAGRIPTVTKLFQKLHPGEKYYLTNIQARGLSPEDVRDWADDLWVFPYYVDKTFVPFDARQGGPAAGAWTGD